MVVTISREYGAAGLAVAEGAAAALGYELLTDDLPATVAARLGTSTEEVAERVASGKPLADRIIGGLGMGTPESIGVGSPRLPGDFDEAVRREIEATIRERAAGGNIVILGRVSNAVLAGRSGLLRVFLTADLGWRVARIVESFHVSPEQARSDIERIDAGRRHFAKERYKIAWGDQRHYDLALNVARFGIETTVELVAAATRSADAAAR